MSDIDQVWNNIQEELKQSRPISGRILNSLCELRLYEEGVEYNPKDEWRYLPESKFFNIVGETFKLNPEFFMKNLYKSFRSKMGKIIGKEKLQAMEKYIIEKYCLYEGEQILFECEGKIEQTSFDTKFTSSQVTKGFSVSKGWILITNYRIIAQGKSKGKSFNLSTFGQFVSDVILRPIRNRKAKAEHTDSSIDQDLPCYGYEFPINSFRVNKGKSKIYFSVYIGKKSDMFTISLPVWSSSSITGDRVASEAIREEKLSKIYEILKKDPDQVLDFIKGELAREKPSHRRIGTILYELQKSEEYKDFTDSEFYDIVGGTYKLNPKFFMDSIHNYLLKRLRKIFDEEKLMEFENFIKNLDIKVDA